MTALDDILNAVSAVSDGAFSDKFAKAEYLKTEDNKTYYFRVLPETGTMSIPFVRSSKHWMNYIDDQGVQRSKPIICEQDLGRPCPMCVSHTYYKTIGDNERANQLKKRFGVTVNILLYDATVARNTVKRIPNKVVRYEMPWSVWQKFEALVRDPDVHQGGTRFMWGLENGVTFKLTRTKDGNFTKYDLMSLMDWNDVTQTDDWEAVSDAVANRDDLMVIYENQPTVEQMLSMFNLPIIPLEEAGFEFAPIIPDANPAQQESAREALASDDSGVTLSGLLESLGSDPEQLEAIRKAIESAQK